MNYKSELRGFAFDRAIRIAEIAKISKAVQQLTKDADDIVDYLYIADKDIESHLASLMPLIIQSANVDKLNELILNLEQIKAEMQAGIIKQSDAEAA